MKPINNTSSSNNQLSFSRQIQTITTTTTPPPPYTSLFGNRPLANNGMEQHSPTPQYTPLFHNEQHLPPAYSETGPMSTQQATPLLQTQSSARFDIPSYQTYISEFPQSASQVTPNINTNEDIAEMHHVGMHSYYFNQSRLNNLPVNLEGMSDTKKMKYYFKTLARKDFTPELNNAQKQQLLAEIGLIGINFNTLISSRINNTQDIINQIKLDMQNEMNDNANNNLLVGFCICFLNHIPQDERGRTTMSIIYDQLNEATRPIFYQIMSEIIKELKEHPHLYFGKLNNLGINTNSSLTLKQREHKLNYLTPAQYRSTERGFLHNLRTNMQTWWRNSSINAGGAATP